MAISTTAHLNFRGEARAALEFYQRVFGGELIILTYQDADNVQDPTESNKIMWGQVNCADGFQVMAYDVPLSMPYSQGTNAFFVSVHGTDANELTAYWHGLSESATIVQDLAPASWSTLYGMLRDRFGVVWVLDLAAEY